MKQLSLNVSQIKTRQKDIDDREAFKKMSNGLDRNHTIIKEKQFKGCFS